MERRTSAFSSARDDAHGDAAAVEHELGREPAEAAGGSPDQHDVALLHRCGVLADDHPVGGRHDEAQRGRLLPGEVGRHRHQLVGLDHRHVGQRAEVGLEAPDLLVGVEHRVLVALGRLEVDVVAVHGDAVAGVPPGHAGAGAQHHGRRVRADDVVVEVVALTELAEPAHPLEEAEGRQRLEDRGPDGVVVERRRHGGDQHLVGTERRERNLVDVQALARVLVLRGHPVEHVDLVLADDGGAHGAR
jgi:hypothetical protein